LKEFEDNFVGHIPASGSTTFYVRAKNSANVILHEKGNTARNIEIRIGNSSNT